MTDFDRLAFEALVVERITKHEGPYSRLAEFVADCVARAVVAERQATIEALGAAHRPAHPDCDSCPLILAADFPWALRRERRRSAGPRSEKPVPTRL